MGKCGCSNAETSDDRSVLRVAGNEDAHFHCLDVESEISFRQNIHPLWELQP
jgi:hypothetical protein